MKPSKLFTAIFLVFGMLLSCSEKVDLGVNSKSQETLDSATSTNIDELKKQQDKLIIELEAAGDPYAVLYQHINYGGQQFVILTKRDYNTLKETAQGGNRNDWASSVKVFNGAVIQLWSNLDWGGSSLTISSDHPSLGADNFNDITTSVLWPNQ